MSLGARYEYSDYTFTLNNVKDNNISRTDHMFTPDISLGYTFSPTAQLNISYNTATVKPPYARITGSRNYVGIHELDAFMVNQVVLKRLVCMSPSVCPLKLAVIAMSCGRVNVLAK